MKRFLMTSLALACFCAPALAGDYTVSPANAPAHHDWYLLNYRTGGCDRAADTAFKSPAAYYDDLRHRGVASDLKSFNFDDGQLFYVTVADGKNYMTFFPDRAGCIYGADLAKRSGLMPDLDKFR